MPRKKLVRKIFVAIDEIEMRLEEDFIAKAEYFHWITEGCLHPDELEYALIQYLN